MPDIFLCEIISLYGRIERNNNVTAGGSGMDNKEEQLSFLRSYDFMKLGQAINHQNWQAAAMTAQRMQKQAKELGLDTFDRQLTNIRQCMLHKQEKQVKDILAVMTAKRAQMLNHMEE